ncbi:MAG: adenosylcobinamide-GDP ribazoletransferase [Rikenellaceae bacterium]|nr:adenosylcobinamide-GDP ribazoletransferase [Rikenellaceae bacterium]
MKQILAAFIYFTRLPLWRITWLRPGPEAFDKVLFFWPLTGWLTAGVMAGVLWLDTQILPYSVAVLLAICARLLLTGAFHEDGLSDFFDGFGGGRDREKILTIMKDSHVGAYGVIGLILYFLLLYTVLSHLPLVVAVAVIIGTDPFCKFLGSTVSSILPYARTAETNKAGFVYPSMTVGTFLISFICGTLPLLLLPGFAWCCALVLPVIVYFLLLLFMKTKIGGFTGDCCGAVFTLCELSFYIGILILVTTGI